MLSFIGFSFPPSSAPFRLPYVGFIYLMTPTNPYLFFPSFFSFYSLMLNLNDLYLKVTDSNTLIESALETYNGIFCLEHWWAFNYRISIWRLKLFYLRIKHHFIRELFFWSKWAMCLFCCICITLIVSMCLSDILLISSFSGSTLSICMVTLTLSLLLAFFISLLPYSYCQFLEGMNNVFQCWQKFF